MTDLWTGAFGDAYHERNALREDEIKRRFGLWQAILFDPFPFMPMRRAKALEIGAGTGNNLAALMEGGMRQENLWAVEPNASAHPSLKTLIPEDHIWPEMSWAIPTNLDLVFTSGVLIHIPPEDLSGFIGMALSYLRDNGWFVMVEYFSKEHREVEYRGEAGRLWTRDFGALVMDEFGLKPLDCGFSWHRLTGLDDLTWWMFRK